MQAKAAYRNRADPEVAVLDALADRQDEGMTVFELRSRVEVDIDTLEAALAELKADGLIEVTEDGHRTVILPDEAVVGPDNDGGDDHGLFEEIRRRLPF
jgi:predicted Rossmann fold nucleotide-binding protein DprA/Smf involved in DNA uptake